MLIIVQLVDRIANNRCTVNWCTITLPGLVCFVSFDIGIVISKHIVAKEFSHPACRLGVVIG